MRRITLLLALVLLAASGCGGHHGPTTRQQVIAYVGSVNTTEYEGRDAFVKVQRVVAGFGRGGSGAKAARQLAAAQTSLVRLRRRVAAVTAPVQARRLRLLLLQLYDDEIALVGELRSLTSFIPRVTAALRPLAAANASSQKAIQAARTPAEAAAAVDGYRGAIAKALAALRRLDPPAVEAPVYRAQVARLRALRGSLAHLVAAIRANDASATQTAERAVARASVSVDSRANQVAQRAAVSAYNARVAAVTALERRIAVERNRLQVAIRLHCGHVSDRFLDFFR